MRTLVFEPWYKHSHCCWLPISVLTYLATSMIVWTLMAPSRWTCSSTCRWETRDSVNVWIFDSADRTERDQETLETKRDQEREWRSCFWPHNAWLATAGCGNSREGPTLIPALWAGFNLADDKHSSSFKWPNGPCTDTDSSFLLLIDDQHLLSQFLLIIIPRVSKFFRSATLKLLKSIFLII